MEDYQQRVLEERAELHSKLTSLLIFLRGPSKLTIAHDETERMRVQHDIMKSYIDILDERIAHFGF